MRIFLDVPRERRIASGDGSITHPWAVWAEEAGATLERLGNQTAGLTDLSGSATLAEVITAYNQLLAALRRIAP